MGRGEVGDGGDGGGSFKKGRRLDKEDRKIQREGGEVRKFKEEGGGRGRGRGKEKRKRKKEGRGRGREREREEEGERERGILKRIVVPRLG